MLNQRLLKFIFSVPGFLEQEISRSLSQKLQPPIPTPPAPQPRELLTIEEESERLARELREVRNRQNKTRPT